MGSVAFNPSANPLDSPNKFPQLFPPVQNAAKTTKLETTHWIRRLDLAAAILLSTVALFLFVVRATHTGSLWRDEADSVQSARLPFSDMVPAVQFSSFPILFPIIVRGYTTILGANDVNLRCFGLIVAVLLLAIGWLSIRKTIADVPLFLLAMVGLNGNFLIAGMSLRGYGLGSLLVLLSFVWTIRFLLDPNARTFMALSVVDLLSLHCLFWNFPIVMGMTTVAVCLLLLQRRLKWTLRLAVLLGISGISLIPYLRQFHSSLSGWERIIKVPVSFSQVWESFFVACGDISTPISIIWLAVLAVAMIGGIWRAAGIGRNPAARERNVLLFGIFLIPLAVLASCKFAMVIQRAPEQRFFLPLTILAAATADLLWVNFPCWLRVARTTLVILATLTLPSVTWSYIIQAESNAETIARSLEQHAAPRDLIVVNPWTYGVTFNWYYHGAANWVTVPEIEDHRIHRYDLVLAKMKDSSPLADLEGEIANTLQSGCRVWIAGQLELSLPGEDPLHLGPAPDPNVGWAGSAYRKAWSQEIGLFLWQHAGEGTPVETATGEIINPRENFSLYRLEGWKD